jgi:hypothetical protein
MIRQMKRQILEIRQMTFLPRQGDTSLMYLDFLTYLLTYLGVTRQGVISIKRNTHEIRQFISDYI